MAQITINVIVGNPRPQSRTSKIAGEVGRQLAALVEGEGASVSMQIIEVAELGSYLFEWKNAAVQEAIAQVSHANILVVASPTYKATYTGLLKCFLDLFPAGGLDGTVAIPVMVGAAPDHSLAVEIFLRPLLIELGASCPTKGLYVLDSEIERSHDVVEKWIRQSQQSFKQAVRLV